MQNYRNTDSDKVLYNCRDSELEKLFEIIEFLILNRSLNNYRISDIEIVLLKLL